MSNPHHTSGNYWAMWWGITLAAVFIVAATVGFTMDDRGTVATSRLFYDVK